MGYRQSKNDVCRHAYVTVSHCYYDTKLNCRVVKYHDTCIFCGMRMKERTSYMNDPPKRKLPYFGPHLQ
nr:MAG TPA: Ogr/Delta-like zinc finger protein [Caudoviricetes sp.]